MKMSSIVLLEAVSLLPKIMKPLPRLVIVDGVPVAFCVVLVIFCTFMYILRTKVEGDYSGVETASRSQLVSFLLDALKHRA